jgi:methionyl-tRNA formyltransferase
VRLVFLGTPGFALPSLEALAASSHEVALVVTQPDRPKGRGKKLEAPPVKALAQKLGVKVAQPPRVSSPEGIGMIEALGPDAGIVCAYGEIISGEVLALAPRGFFNVHASLLPKFRGAAPVQRAMLAGESKTGVTIIRLVEEMDAGDILGAAKTEIAPEDTAGTLTDRLARLGARALVEALDRVEAGTAAFTPQDEAQATYAPKITKAGARIDWAENAEFLERFIRAMCPRPGAFTYFDHGGGPARLVVGSALTAGGAGKPGEVLDTSAGRLVVGTGRAQASATRALELLQVQPQGKRMMTAAEFLRGYRMEPGSMLGHERD